MRYFIKQTETLDLAFHREVLIRVALKKYKLKKDAAKALGMSTRALSRVVAELDF